MTYYSEASQRAAEQTRKRAEKRQLEREEKRLRGLGAGDEWLARARTVLSPVPSSETKKAE